MAPGLPWPPLSWTLKRQQFIPGVTPALYSPPPSSVTCERPQGLNTQFQGFCFWFPQSPAGLPSAPGAGGHRRPPALPSQLRSGACQPMSPGSPALCSAHCPAVAQPSLLEQGQATRRLRGTPPLSAGLLLVHSPEGERCLREDWGPAPRPAMSPAALQCCPRQSQLRVGDHHPLASGGTKLQGGRSASPSQPDSPLPLVLGWAGPHPRSRPSWGLLSQPQNKHLLIFQTVPSTSPAPQPQRAHGLCHREQQGTACGEVTGPALP